MTRRAEGGREGGREGGQAPVGEAAPVDLAGRTPLGWRVSAAGEKKELEEVLWPWVGCCCGSGSTISLLSSFLHDILSLG